MVAYFSRALKKVSRRVSNLGILENFNLNTILFLFDMIKFSIYSIKYNFRLARYDKFSMMNFLAFFSFPSTLQKNDD